MKHIEDIELSQEHKRAIDNIFKGDSYNEASRHEAYRNYLTILRVLENKEELTIVCVPNEIIKYQELLSFIRACFGISTEDITITSYKDIPIKGKKRLSMFVDEWEEGT